MNTWWILRGGQKGHCLRVWDLLLAMGSARRLRGWRVLGGRRRCCNESEDRTSRGINNYDVLNYRKRRNEPEGREGQEITRRNLRPY